MVVEWRELLVNFLGGHASSNRVSTTLDHQLSRTARAANNVAKVTQLLGTKLGKNLPDAWRRNGRRPIVIESWKDAVRCDFTGLDANQTRVGPKAFKCAQARNFGVRRQDGPCSQASHGNMDILVRETTSLNIPCICGNGAPGPNDTPQFRDPFGRVWKEENDKRHDGRVEGGGRIRELHCGTQGEGGHTRAVAVSGKRQLRR